MKVTTAFSILVAMYCGFSYSQGLNNNFDPQVVVGPFASSYGPITYICVTLPPGFDNTEGAQLKGATKALDKQGDEGFDVARQRFFSRDENCVSFIAYVPDDDPLPKDQRKISNK